MKNIYIIISVIIVFLIFIGLFFIDVPSPTKLVKEKYHLEVK
tara:strand:+ start:653 stop:778 length:126 start_codon:yes stop_codon:yes gene_type:complete